MKTLNDIEVANLIIRARRERLWLHCRYQNLWFSPDELEQSRRKGLFRWSASEWELRDPAQALASIQRRIDNLEKEKQELRRRIA